MIDDLLHPHHGGYELWRDAVMPKFAEMLGR
jgi:lysophospholipase L1-like esterase